MRKIFLFVGIVVSILYATISFFFYYLWIEYFLCVKYHILGCIDAHTFKGNFKELRSFIIAKYKDHE